MIYKQMFYLGDYSVGFTSKYENDYRVMGIIYNDEHIQLITSNEGYEILISLINDYEDATNSDEADKAKRYFEYITGIERG